MTSHWGILLLYCILCYWISLWWDSLQVLNIVLRVAWMQLVIEFNLHSLQKMAITTIISCLEVFRRGIWNFFRYISSLAMRKVMPSINDLIIYLVLILLLKDHVQSGWRMSTWTMLASTEHSSQFRYLSVTMMKKPRKMISITKLSIKILLNSTGKFHCLEDHYDVSRKVHA